jgi:outer membrane murein-binding lipoprotein Lpp
LAPPVFRTGAHYKDLTYKNNMNQTIQTVNNDGSVVVTTGTSQTLTPDQITSEIQELTTQIATLQQKLIFFTTAQQQSQQVLLNNQVPTPPVTP